MSKEKGNTKERIFVTALDLFAGNNYHTISMRDIADRVGIQPSSIYNHYNSKEDLLLAIYRYFDENMSRLMPDLDSLLEQVGRVHPHEILYATNFHYPPEIMDSMAKAMLITASMVRVDARADECLFKNLVNAPYRYDPPLLERMVELDEIEPPDVDSFTLVHSCYCHSAAVRFYYEHIIDDAAFDAGHRTLVRIIQVKHPEKYAKAGGSAD